jgi:hypothetical protein
VAAPYPYPTRIAEKKATGFITEIGLRSTGAITVPYPESYLAESEVEPGGEIFLNLPPRPGPWQDRPLVYRDMAVEDASRVFDSDPRNVTYASLTTLGDGTAGMDTLGEFTLGADTTANGTSFAYWRDHIYFVSVAERFTFLVVEQQWVNYSEDSQALNTTTVSAGSITAPSWTLDANVIGSPFGTKQYLYGGDDGNGLTLLPTPGIDPGVIAVWYNYTAENTDNLNGRVNGWKWEGTTLEVVALWDTEDTEAYGAVVDAMVPATNEANYSSALITLQAISDPPTEGFEEQAAGLTLVRFKPTPLYTETEPNQFDLNPADSLTYTARLRHPTVEGALWDYNFDDIKAVDDEFVLIADGGLTVVLVNREWTEYRVLSAIAHDEPVCTAFTEAFDGDRFFPDVYKVNDEWMWLFREQRAATGIVARTALLAKDGPLAEGFPGCVSTPPFTGDDGTPPNQVPSFFVSTQMSLEENAILDAILYNPPA